jgi:translocation and assembly module TamA
MTLRHSLIFCCLFFVTSARADSVLCNHIVIKDGKLKLKKNEKVLVCGSPHAGQGWQDVPLPQARYQLSVLLQNAGYPEPHFERAGEELRVWKGPLLRTRKLAVTGADGLLNADKKRKVVGQAMTPGKLDEVTQWADLGLRRQGYACPIEKVVGQAWNQEIHADIAPGGKKTVGRIERSGLDGLDPNAIHRFEAYREGAPYDVIETQITAARMLTQGLFQSAYFATTCRDDHVDLHLYTDVGKSRLVRFGLGASTEEFPFADLWFKNARLDDKASNYTANLHLSPIWQSLHAESELYFVSSLPQVFVGPRFTLEHRTERAFEKNEMDVGADVGRGWDVLHARVDLRTGPTFTYEKTVRGQGPRDIKYLSWQARSDIVSHGYEAFAANQTEGWTAGLRYQTQRKGIGSPINVDRYGASLKHLWNLGAYSPPLFILATRLEAEVVNAELASETDRALLPTDYRLYYGGDENLRGFARESLNNGEIGYLTALYAGFELRLTGEIPYHIEPFLLLDVAKLGDRRYTLRSAIYYSPGFGVRWASPFGTLRGTLAHGEIAKRDETDRGYKQELVGFLSFGQEF